MRCPTCGKSVPKHQTTCSNCGGLVVDPSRVIGIGEAASGRKPGGSIFFPTQPLAPEETPEETIEPEEIELEEPEPDSEPARPGPAPPPRPSTPGWWRYLVPLIFVLAPLLSYLLRNLPFGIGLRPEPILRQVILCEGVARGLPVNPKTVFSLRQDRRVVLYGRWNGTRGGHELTLRWYQPNGTLQPIPITVMGYQAGQRGFANFGALPLASGMPAGRWHVELLLNGKRRARSSFELRE